MSNVSHVYTGYRYDILAWNRLCWESNSLLLPLIQSWILHFVSALQNFKTFLPFTLIDLFSSKLTFFAQFIIHRYQPPGSFDAFWQKSVENDQKRLKQHQQTRTQSAPSGGGSSQHKTPSFRKPKRKRGNYNNDQSNKKNQEGKKSWQKIQWFFVDNHFKKACIPCSHTNIQAVAI